MPPISRRSPICMAWLIQFLPHALSGEVYAPSKTSLGRYISFVCTLEQKPFSMSMDSASFISASTSARADTEFGTIFKVMTSGQPANIGPLCKWQPVAYPVLHHM